MGIWVGRFAIVRGDVREHGPWLVEQRRGHDGEAVRLLVLAEPADERSAGYCADVAAAVADLFAQEELSLTGGLVRAIRRAHSNLAEWNSRSLREHRVAIGVTCVALRGGEATIAQAGPGLVYLARAGAVRRVTTEGEPAAAPLGGEAGVAPQFVAAATADTSILLLGSAAERAAGRAELGRALAAPHDRVLGEVFRMVRGLPDLHAAYVADLPLSDEAIEAAAAAGAEALGEYPPAPERPAAPRQPAPHPPAPATRWRPERERRRMPSLRRTGVAGGGGGPSRRWLLGGLLALVVLGALAWLAAPRLPGGGEDTSLDARLRRASGLLEAAATAPGAGESRDSLNAALRELEEARSIDAEEPRIAALQEAVQRRLAEVNGVTPVAELRSVFRFEGAVTAPVDPVALVFGGNRLWVLDAAGGGRVIAIDPGGVAAPADAYRAGTDQRYGGFRARAPAGVAWDAEEGRLLILDSGRSLFGVTPGDEPAPLPLRAARGIDARGIGAVEAIAAYAGRLYLLDGEGGEVWRYPPAVGGFDSERQGLLGSIDLGEPRGLYVDGDVFVLGEGGVRRFSSLGPEGAAQLADIDAPVEDAAGIAGDASRGVILVADRGGRRIVSGDRDGPFLRQYVHPDFTDLRGLALSEGGGVLYVLTGDGVRAFDLEPGDGEAGGGEDAQ